MTFFWLLAGLAGLILAIGYAGAYVAVTGGKKIPLTFRPETAGVPYEPLELRSRDGVALKGWFVPAESPSRRTLVFCHGWGANKGEVLRNTHALRRDGYNLLYFDFRCCGESGGERLSVGVLEAADLDAALEWLRAARPEDSVAVYGMSMGAMVAFGGLVRHPFLKAAVLDSPYLSHDQALARYAWAKFRLSYYPFMPIVFFWVRRWLGTDPQAISPERLAGRVGDRPTLIICGENDVIATPAIGRALLDVLQGPKELWVVPGARHGKCGETAGDEYRRKLSAFYSRNLY